MANIRNFCIIAHIDHGKSTLADRMLELTGTIDKRKMKNQILDQMDIERERGITIKLQPVTMDFKGYTLNLIDTPGHVDFNYEVSRSLAAVEGAVLLVDATQGIQAQTLANLYLAIEQNLTIIPVANKVDLPAADKEKTKREIIELLGCKEDEIIFASGKTGEGVENILQAVIEKVPAPLIAEKDEKARALIFDSNYDEYKGVVAYIRVMEGAIKKGDRIKLLATGATSEALDVGIFKPAYLSTNELEKGKIGYIITGFKDVSECRVGDTVVLEKNSDQLKPLKGYTEVKPMVFAGVFPKEGNEYQELREAINRLKLNDAALIYEPEHSHALGFGFRCGFLGILHLEIFQERLRREFNIELIVTLPSVAYQVYLKNGESFIMRTPQQFPEREKIEMIEEPWVILDIITPKEFVGNIMNLAQEKRGIYKNTEYIDESRAILHYEIPMSTILTDFYDKIKSVSSGYASINYEFSGYKEAQVIKMDILVAEEIVEALSTIVYEDDAHRRGKEIVTILKDSMPKQMFVLKLQATIGGKIIASEKVSAMRKDVTAKLYGGDVTRKRKLLEKQKKGKKKMMAAGKGSVDIPSDTFVKLLKK
ncbi:MAG: Elongation factor 4 [Candidatus Falkowbacteria bacterium GW2011_GWC2_38_22]|uniref:Elongation factor 4 n=1 Tax=Candidatus Falkowbacteria bacterium GW2011_GWE1_38_31 TaxID=1618638 RepID=A0A0G0K688_9BACT|nr:MAG: Elongation factor 4 [Candidatus Falkowbacteria bacterium GW2011_GWF2_38_1205]KKQ62145.1 MAG: Elongation factor 4 [Candidatus Falkowbacteria bacterium GW2011_GWC2_38_22]KKQ64295.1 MAG: Elongation factor 4 [Candidatus Falkowbacteria bacterium GW2011_GWF1_38_22]KKQ66272.1 MAG: Elongation factor 4 [Candidatus Falkowbacteria bacterium GW2011_GWE2_38_254]KKQ71000.1 MAG: Elongation factor 4 [Candidatus Falkowbacteria bacterium GW2011_GWE1_38_31]KKQ73509.1 MAG: Elongation factor 4 [Candidatus 